MAPVFRHVSLTEIALHDHTFIVTYRPELQALQRSVACIGVLTPLHLRQPSDQAPLQVVCGSKRLLACQQTGHTSVPALVYSAAELSEQQAFLFALHDNLGCRVLNAVEKARILLRLRQHFHYQPGALLQEFCALLELPPRLETLEAYCLLATLEDPLQAAVVEGALPLETALWIGEYDAEDRQALLGLFTGLKIGTNRAREFTTYIDEICQRDACRPAGLLQGLGVPTVLADGQLSGPQKLDSVRRVLRQARYPQLSTYEQRFQEAVRRLRLPPQISLRPPPYFEGQQYQVTLSFGQPQELRHYAQRLLDASGHEALAALLELL
jgi:ParB family transcriptional regulator, chromosome partitioning protein